MSDVFALDTAGQQRADEEARATGITPDTVTPGFWYRAVPGAGTLFMRGGANVGRFLGMAGGALLSMGASATPVEPVGPEVTSQAERDQSGEELLDGYFRKMDRTVTNAVDFWTPRPNEVGTAGRILGGLAEAALPLMAGGGNPSLLIGTQEMGTATDLVRKGVSAPAAVGVGAIQGAATAVGFRVPFLGRSIAERMGSGVAGNLAVGMGTALASQGVLNAAGETEASKSFDPLDLEARAVDVLTGAAFGGIAHVQMRSAERTAAIAVANAQHFQEQTAPGVPADITASTAHQAAMETAMRQLMTGDPVVAPREVTEATFSPREFVEQSLRERGSAVSEHLPEESAATNPIPTAEHLSPQDRAVESRFREQVGSGFDAATKAYEKLQDSHGGKVLNTDIARELSPDYLKDRTLSAAVHEPASYLVKEMYARKLAQAPGPGEDPLVLFSAGGTGAGKTTGLRAIPDVVSRAQIIYDTNMNTLKGAVSKIDQALEAGKRVQIVYTYRDPIEALTGGALPRAMRQEKKFGSGRTVPIHEHVATHVGARAVVEQIAAHYENEARVTMAVIDNSGARGVKVGPKGVEIGSVGPKISTLREIPKFGEGAYNSLRERAIKALEAEHAAGRISDAIRRGFAGPDVLRPEPRHGVREAGRPDRTGDRGQPQAPASGGRVDDPLTASVRERLQESDLRIPTGEIDADGNSVTRSAREALAQADADILDAKSMGRAIMAAVTCAIQRGA